MTSDDPVGLFLKGEFDRLKTALQGVGTAVTELGQRITRHENHDTERHEENVQRLARIEGKLTKHRERLDSLEDTTEEITGVEDPRQLDKIARQLRSDLRREREARENAEAETRASLEREGRHSRRLVRMLVGMLIAAALGGGLATYREVTRPNEHKESR